MPISSGLEKYFAGRKRKARCWSLVDRIVTATRSSATLEEGLGAAASELGQTLGLARAAVAAIDDHGRRASADYRAPGATRGFKEELEQIDAEIARVFRQESSIVVIEEIGADARLSGLLRGDLGQAIRSFQVTSILFAPIRVDARILGAIILYCCKHQRWSGEEKQAVRVIASSLSLSVYQAIAEEKAKDAAKQEALANQVLASIRGAVGADKIIKVAVEGIGLGLGVTRSVVYMRDWDDEEGGDGRRENLAGFRAAAEYRASVLVPSLLNTPFDAASTALPEALAAGHILTASDTQKSLGGAPKSCVRLGVQAFILAPIAYNGHIAGVLALEQFESARDFSSDEVDLVRQVAMQTAAGLYQAELYREAQEAAKREALISRIGSAIHSSLDSDAVLQAIVKELGAALSVCRCRLALLPDPLPEIAPVTHEYIASCCSGRKPPPHRLPTTANSYVGIVMNSLEPIAAADAGADSRLASFAADFKRAGVQSALGAAIRIDGKPIGVLGLHHCERRHAWTQWEIAVVKSVAEQAAVAIRQAELYREVREAAMRSDLINEIVASIRRSLDLKETLQVAVDELGRAIGANRTYFRQAVGNELVVVAENLTEPHLSVRSAPAGMSGYIAQRLMQTHKTLVIDDVASFTGANPEAAATVALWRVEPPSLSQIVCPIFVSDKFWGALSISQVDRPRKWKASEIALIEVVTAQIEVAVSHSHLFEEAKQAARREALIGHIIHGINQSNQVDEIFPIISKELADHLSADRVVITKLNHEATAWVVECEFSEGRIRSPKGRYSVEEANRFVAMQEGNLIVCNDTETDPRAAPLLDQFLRPVGVRSFMTAQVAYEGVGRLSITASMVSGPRNWTREEQEIIGAAADQVYVALQRSELFEQISHGKYEWEATFDALNDGIFIFDQRGLLRRVNQAAAAFEGAPVQDLIGRQCCTLMQGIEGEQCRVASVVSSARPITFELVAERFARPLLVTISPLFHRHRFLEAGANDSPAERDADGAVCIVRDLSELRAAEAVAREQRGFLVKLIEHANDAIFALEPSGRMIWFNEQLVTLSGYDREQLNALDISRLIPEEESRQAVARFKKALCGEAQTFEFHGVRKTGESRLLLITYTPIYDEGRVTSVLCIARDVTEERLASARAAQADKLRALGQLASGVAHNFNNILAAILGHAQLVKRECQDERTLQRIDIIERAALDGAQTVKRIQGFGLQQSEGALESTDVGQIVMDSANLTRARWCDDAQARGIYYDVELDLKPTLAVRGAPSELREVFVNIILNALDAMPQGGSLRISAEMNGSTVEIHFKDSGIGMTQAVREHIFEPFFTTKSVTGMGLGLAVSYSIVERHGGRIETRSRPGRGTTFIVALPASDALRREIPQDLGARVKGASVLVIDDDERVREALVGMLRLAGHVTAHASSGREALRKMEHDRFDLVFTDLSMPEMDGWAVASEIHRRWPGVKIVMITGYAVSPETVKHHRDLVRDVIFKPIRFDDISATLSQIL